ncbi:MAG: hypothetical protein RLZZ555_1048 [Pseudomonadota bacterium]|jgi:RNA polymerase sigma-70 factor (ECF subfamily)
MSRQMPPNPSTDSDLLLVRRAQAGEMRAFELLVLKYQRRVERLVARLLRDPGLVEDAAQETFIRAYKALGQFRGDSAFYTWLYRIAVNTARKQIAEIRRDPVQSMSSLETSDGDETSGLERELIQQVADFATPEALLASKEIAEAVNAAMEGLPSELRQAITLREIEGLSYDAIARSLDCPVGTVRSRIFRAREAISARLRPLLERQGGKRW